MRSDAATRIAAAALALFAALAPATARPVQVDVLDWSFDPGDGAGLAFLSGLELRSPDPEFGGFSALEVSADGGRLVALSDRGLWLEARLTREAGRLVGVAEAELHPLLGPEGEPPPFVWRDSEGLAIPDPALAGPRVVSFERAPRLAAFDGPEAPERPSPGPAEIGAAHPNEGLEALAVAPDGRLLAIRERPDPGTARFRAWWIDPDGAVRPTDVPQLAPKMAVGADFAPDGRLFVLARTFSGRLGFRYAVWRFHVDGDALTDGEVLLDIAPGEAGENGEGVAVWRDAEGLTRILVVTDDNMSLMQRTLLLEFALLD